MKKLLTAGGCSLLIATAMANNLTDQQLQQKIEKMGVTNVKIGPSELPNFKSVTTDQGIAQISQDGRFVIYGQIFELKDGKAVNITHRALLAEMETFANEMIVFPAKKPKHQITVFMDISCHYCQVLHSKIAAYNELGISVRYLAFPRGGLETQTAKQMEAIWTAKDPAFALNEAEAGKLPQTLKTPNVVKKQHQLGLKFGVSGTPTIISQSGEVIPGFVEPAELLKMLEE